MPFNTALSGLQAASSELRVIGNNIANSSTTGFKESRAEFADIYANSGLGSSDNSIGAGVALSSVTQQFSQGQISFTNNNLDLAISGQGFFILSKGGELTYTRAGAFGVDKNGFVTNSQERRLQGFLADAGGNITGTQGDLQISSQVSSPNPTTSIGVTVNLESSETPPTVPFTTGFTPTNPPDANSFNASSSTTIFDSLGNSHIQTTYFVKAPTQNTWNVFVGIDGYDVTPTPATPPVGVPPQPYPAGSLPSPFTIVFDQNGNYVVNDTGTPPQFYGPGPVAATAGPLQNSGTIPTLGINDLTINGIQIDPSITNSADNLSTSDTSASAIAFAAAINNLTNEHGVTATVTPNALNIGAPTLGALAAGDLTLNNVPIVGPVATDADLLTLFNNQTPNTGVVATQPGGAGTAITLTAADGRNIHLQTDGTTGGANFAGFAINGGTALNQVIRGGFNLTTANNLGVNITGASPATVGLSLGPQSGIIQANSDILSINDWIPPSSPGTPQVLNLDLGQSTQFGAAFAVNNLTQDGYSTGRLSGIEISNSGEIVARFSNGQSRTLGQVALANFGNVQGLSPLGDTTWGESFSSGAALVGEPGTSSFGVIQSGSLEESNVQLTEQLVNLITSQRNFQANAQTIRTAEAVTQAIINLR